MSASALRNLREDRLVVLRRRRLGLVRRRRLGLVPAAVEGGAVDFRDELVKLVTSDLN